MTKLEKIEKVLSRPIEKRARLDGDYQKGFRAGLIHARQEIAGILLAEDKLTDFLMTRTGMYIYDYFDVRYVLGGVKIKAPDNADLKKYHLVDYKQIDDVFYLFIEKQEKYEE